MIANALDRTTFTLGKYPSRIFEIKVSIIYETIVYWKRTYFFYYLVKQENDRSTKKK